MVHSPRLEVGVALAFIAGPLDRQRSHYQLDPKIPVRLHATLGRSAPLASASST